MKTVDLSKVLEMLINEEQTEATGLLHEWFVETSKKVNADLMAEDNSLSQDIEDDQEAIKSEEFYSEAEGDDEVEADADEVATDDVDGDDTDADLEPGAEIESPEEVDAEVALGDTIEDLEAVMARLKAEFAEITGAGADEEPVADMDDMDGDDVAEPVGMDTDDVTDESLAFESADAEGDDADGEDEDAEEVTESEDDFADLEESWNLEPVKATDLVDGKEIGADGKKFTGNDKSPLPEHDADGRVGGEAVEIHSEDHVGYDREAAPEVKAKPLLKNQVKKSTDGRTKVSKEGDKSAKLNSKDGFGSDSPKSPIGGGAADLRGSDFKRK